MYSIKCDGYTLYDPRDDELIVDAPKVNLEVNTVGDGSFTIYETHPHYGRLKKLKSIFEVSDEIGVIFRGRMTGNSCDFNNCKMVDMEGMMACFNDSIVRPYLFPDDFLEDEEYINAANSGNVVAFYLGWLIDQHNEQVTEAQRFKLGNVTVADPNNFITRSDSAYPNTWETIRSKLFESSLGGYICARYEEDGTYIDYLSKFELVNTQEIVFGENLLDLKTDTDAKETYSAIVPIGKRNEDGEDVVLTIAAIADGDITDDIVKKDDLIYSRSAVESYGFIVAPISETTWEDVTDANNLLTKGVDFLVNDGMLLTETVEVSAVDLHFTDEQVQSFRIYRNVNVKSSPHGHFGTYMLPRLGLDLANPQNTKITVGSTHRTLVDINSQRESKAAQQIESAKKDIEASRTQASEVMNQVTLQSTEMVNTCNQIVFRALESYLETGRFDEFKSTLETELSVWANGIIGRITETSQQIENVNGDLQEKFNAITKYFTFDINGFTVGRVDSANKIVIDNDDITIYASGNPVQTFKADGTSLIPTLNVTKMLNVVGLQIASNDTHINCEYIKG